MEIVKTQESPEIKIPSAGEDSQGHQMKQYLTFDVMSEQYGVNIMSVLEIKGWTEATRLPNAPEYMQGVINLRGAIIPIFDLKHRFSGEASTISGKHVFIIMAVKERNIGILVDGVSDILDVQESEIKPVPELDSAKQTDFISGLISKEKDMVVLLDIENLFTKEEIMLANQIPVS